MFGLGEFGACPLELAGGGGRAHLLKPERLEAGALVSDFRGSAHFPKSLGLSEY